MENIIIAGRGKTSRANIEALMEDYYYANKSVTVRIAYTSEITDSLSWAKQHAEDMNVNTLEVFGDLQDLFDELKTTDTSVFLVWDDEDTDCQQCLSLSKDNGWPVYDLTNGLCTISGVAVIPKVQEPVMPPEETLEEEDDTEDDAPSSDPLYEAVAVIADLIAEAVYERLIDMQKRRR